MSVEAATRYSSARFPDDYCAFSELERCMHLCDVRNYNQDTLSSVGMARKGVKILSNRAVKVLWFSIQTPPEDHHKYGNLSFVIKLQKIVNYFGSSLHMHYAEKVVSGGLVTSRILLTRRDFTSSIPELDITQVGYPIYKDPAGQLYYLKHTDNGRTPHEVDFLFHVIDKRDPKWLFENSLKIPVDHSCANDVDYDNPENPQIFCHKYVTMERDDCPFEYSCKQTTSWFDEHLPGYLDQHSKQLYGIQ